MGTSPFHAGELALQEEVGAREQMAAVGARVIRAAMPDQHRELFEKLPMVWVGTLDDAGQPWATAVHGPPGFVRTPDAQTLRIGTAPGAADPARAGMKVGAAVGLLGLEPETRRRNRANGVIVAVDEDGWTVRVHQSFGNCPKYIHRRAVEHHPGRVAAAARLEGPQLSAEALRLIAASDTLFLASSSAGVLDGEALVAGGGAGVDVSHRGGPTGFLEVERGAEGDVLVLDDYRGNAMFNTLGNLELWPRAGLVLVDLTEGHVLQLATTASLRREPGRGEGVLRRLALRVERGWLRPHAAPFGWRALDAEGSEGRSG